MPTWLKSKKLLVLIVGVASVVMEWLVAGGPFPVDRVVILISAYLGAQGLADIGKEKVKAMNPPPPKPPQVPPAA